MLGTFDLINCFYFASVISTFDTAYLCCFCVNLSAVALLYLVMSYRPAECWYLASYIAFFDDKCSSITAFIFLHMEQ